MSSEAQRLGVQAEEALRFLDRQIGDSECGLHWQRQFRNIAALIRALAQQADGGTAGACAPLEWSKAVQEAYGWLWHVNNEPLAPVPLWSPEKAAYEARKCLRELLTMDQRGEGINAVRGLLQNKAAATPPTALQDGPRCKGCDIPNGCPEYCRCAPQDGAPAAEVVELRDYKALCDLWDEANALGTVLGSQERLMLKIKRLRDDFGARQIASRGAEGRQPHCSPCGERCPDCPIDWDMRARALLSESTTGGKG